MGDLILKGPRSKPTVISLAGAVVTLVPSSFVYDGREHTQGVASVVLNGQTLTPGTDYTILNNSATNAGDYRLTIIGIRAYKGAVQVPWSISKATGSLSVSPSSLSIQGTGSTDTATVTATGDGALSVTSSNNSVAMASISGTTVTVEVVGAGSATVTVTMINGTNYTGATTSITVEATIAHVYGVSWDGTSTTAWSRTDDAVGFADPVPYVSGATSYSSPFDNLMPWSGITKVEDSEAGTMVAIPKFWYTLTQNGAGMKIQIADAELDGFHVSPAHMDRGDGKGERDVVYIGRYHCGASAYKSASGQKPKVSITRRTARTQIHNLGSTIWQVDWAMRFTIGLLYLVEFANWNSQDKIGYGCGNIAVQNMGASDSMPYHTGTMQTSRTTYGVGVQYRNIEGLWDNCYDWIDGCYNNSSGLNLILNPANFSNSSGGVSVGTPSIGYPSAFSVKNVSGFFPLFLPSATNGSDSTYSCDYWYFYSSYPCVYAGGNYYQSLNYGLFFWNCTSASSTGGDLGSRSMKLP